MTKSSCLIVSIHNISYGYGSKHLFLYNIFSVYGWMGNGYIENPSIYLPNYLYLYHPMYIYIYTVPNIYMDDIYIYRCIILCIHIYMIYGWILCIYIYIYIKYICLYLISISKGSGQKVHGPRRSPWSPSATPCAEPRGSSNPNRRRRRTREDVVKRGKIGLSVMIN